ncbi:3928_t:CDS:2, partial [Acaulospora colombiana]
GVVRRRPVPVAGGRLLNKSQKETNCNHNGRRIYCLMWKQIQGSRMATAASNEDSKFVFRIAGAGKKAKGAYGRDKATSSCFTPSPPSPFKQNPTPRFGTEKFIVQGDNLSAFATLSQPLIGLHTIKTRTSQLSSLILFSPTEK